VTESWKEKISSFEKVNSDLKSNLAELKQENDDLKQQVIQFYLTFKPENKYLFWTMIPDE